MAICRPLRGGVDRNTKATLGVSLLLAALSPPTRGRGSKQGDPDIKTFLVGQPSPPTRGRGSKLLVDRNRPYSASLRVAPYAGAWIETVMQSDQRHATRDRHVAPYAGAWIETETWRCRSPPWITTSPPTRGRGSKRPHAGHRS